MKWKLISVIFLICFFVPYAALGLLRVYQENNLYKLFDNYLAEKTEIITPVINDENNSYIIKIPKKMDNPQISHLETTYLKISTKNNCNSSQISINIHYLEEPPFFWEAPKMLTIPVTAEMVYFLPIYNFHNGLGNNILNEAFLPSYWIDQLEYSNQDANCIQNIAFVKNTKTFPLLLTLKLQNDWRLSKLYQFIQNV